MVFDVCRRERSASFSELAVFKLLLSLIPTSWAYQEEACKLLAENAELKREVERLKRELILEEIRNGGIAVM